jgi:hypothetical protein
LPDPSHLLEGTGKSLRHVEVQRKEELKNPALRKLIQAAVLLNKKEPMQGMKPRKEPR